jgi:hypothetical protein
MGYQRRAIFQFWWPNCWRTATLARKLKPMRAHYATSNKIAVDPQWTEKTCSYETINLVSRKQSQTIRCSELTRLCWRLQLDILFLSELSVTDVTHFRPKCPRSWIQASYILHYFITTWIMVKIKLTEKYVPSEWFTLTTRIEFRSRLLTFKLQLSNIFPKFSSSCLWRAPGLKFGNSRILH